MVELILVRHGETDSNKKGTYLGWTDIELNEAGIKQAYCVKEKLKDIKIEALFSSPLKRTRKTAEIINQELNLNIEYSNDLKERNFGVWDDLTYDEIVSKFPEEHDLWTKDWMNYAIKDGESSIQSYNRIKTFADSIMKNKNDGIFVIVTHLGCIRMLLAYLLGMGIEGSWRFRVDNCSITKIEIIGEYPILTLLNV